MSASSLKITPFRAISNTLLHIFVVYLYVFILYFKVSLEDGHLGQATPHDILYVHCKLLHLTLLNVICREINFDLI